MGRYVQLVLGPAGCGKSTYCNAIIKHMQASKRSAIVVNLDPAAEKFHYDPTIDIRDLISLDDVMNEMDLGPNGGLVYCMEYLLDNFDWFEEQVGTEWEDEYIIIDCPGQIELFAHSTIIKQFVRELQTRMHMSVCVVYLLESQFITDVTKFFSGVLTAMSTMIQLEVPHINVLSKMDLIEGRPGEQESAASNAAKLFNLNVRSGQSESYQDEEENDESPRVIQNTDPDVPQSGYTNTWTPTEELSRDRQTAAVQLDRFLEPDPNLLLETANKSMSPKWQLLNEAIVRLVDEYSMVSFMPLNIHDEDSMDALLASVDVAIQFGEDEEPKEPKEFGDDDNNGGDGVSGDWSQFDQK